MENNNINPEELKEKNVPLLPADEQQTEDTDNDFIPENEDQFSEEDDLEDASINDAIIQDDDIEEGDIEYDENGQTIISDNEEQKS